MPLEGLPPEILQSIAALAALPRAVDQPHPPVLLPLLLTSRTLYARLCPTTNHHLLLVLFRASFDTSALQRRFGRRRLTQPALAAECIRRCSVLHRVRKASHGGWTESTYPFMEDLWSVYLMLLEDDGRNSALLTRYAGAVHWLWSTIRVHLLLPSAAAAGRPPGSPEHVEAMWYGHSKGEIEHTGLILWCLWYLVGHARDPLPFTHPLLVDLDRFAIFGIQYPALYFPSTHWQLPIYIDSPAHLPEHTPPRNAPDLHHPLHAFQALLAQRTASTDAPPVYPLTRTAPPARRLPFHYFPHHDDPAPTRHILRAPPLLPAVTLLGATRFVDIVRAHIASHMPAPGPAAAAAAALDAYTPGALLLAEDWGSDVRVWSPHLAAVPQLAPMLELIDAFYARVGLGTAAPPRPATAPADDEEEEVQEEVPPSLVRDDEWNRAVQCVRVVNCPGLDAADDAELDESGGPMVQLGALAGVWEGLICGSDVRPPSSPGEPAQCGLAWRPTSIRLREYHCLDHHDRLPPGWDDEWSAEDDHVAPADANPGEDAGTDDDDEGPADEDMEGGDGDDAASPLLGNGARNAWLPRGITLVERGDTLEAADPRTGRTHRYAHFRPGARAPYAPPWMARLHADTHMHGPANGEVVELECSGVHDVLLVGETPPSGESWGKYVYVGRLRAWDGMVCLLRYPIVQPGGQPPSGRWLFSGYLHACPPGSPRDYNFVGRWRETGTAGGLMRIGFEGSFVMAR